MAKLNHNPEEIEDGIPEGLYDFQVTSAALTEFRTGNNGMTMVLNAFNNDYNFTVYENFTFTAKSKWKLKRLCEAIGVEFDSEELDTDDIEGKAGKAVFRRKKGDMYLEVGKFLTAEEAEGWTADKGFEDNVPF